MFLGSRREVISMEALARVVSNCMILWAGTGGGFGFGLAHEFEDVGDVLDILGAGLFGDVSGAGGNSRARAQSLTNQKTKNQKLRCLHPAPFMFHYQLSAAPDPTVT